MASRKAATKFIFMTLFLDVLGFGLLIPVGPKLVQELLNPGGVPGTDEQAAHYYGWLIASYALMQFIFSPVLGVLSDRFGRRPVLLFSICGSGIDYFASAIAPNLAWLFVTRAINGLTGASITVCNAYIADVTEPKDRAKAYGMVGAAFGMGFVFGPVLGGILGDMNIRYPFYAAGGLSILNWLYGLFLLPESLPLDRRGIIRVGRMNPIGAMRVLASYPLVAAMAGSLFLLNLAMFGLHATWVLYTTHRYQWSKTEVGISLAVVGIGAGIVQGGLARKIIPALGPGVIGERRAALLGIFLGVLSYIGYGSATQGWMIYTIIAFASFGGVCGPAIQALISRSVLPTEQGTVQGALTSLQSIASILGPLVGTAVFAFAISPETHAWFAYPGLSFYASALFAALGLVVAFWALEKAHLPTNEQPAASAPAANTADQPPSVEVSAAQSRPAETVSGTAP